MAKVGSLTKERGNLSGVASCTFQSTMQNPAELDKLQIELVINPASTPLSMNSPCSVVLDKLLHVCQERIASGRQQYEF